MNTLPFEGFQSLSESERKAFALLQDLQHESIWGLAIKNVCTDPSISRFRQLIRSLKSQAADCADTMKAILGPSYDLVIAA